MSAKKSLRSGSHGLPPANAHPAREPAGAPSDPVTVLKTLPVGTRDYLRVLGAILRLHNHQHSSKHNGVSFKTMLDRQRFLASFFTELRKQTRYHDIDPRQLANRHIEAIIKRWLERGLSTATIHNYLSFLRTFAGWINKPGMVREVEYYVGTDSPHAKRQQVATRDHSWPALSVDFEAALPAIAEFDLLIGIQLELCYRFGMRPKEARHFRPHMAIVPREQANPRDAEAFPEHDTFVRIKFGTKGGRPRDVPVVNDAQRELLARATTAVALGAYVGRPGYTAEQNRRRFYYVLERFGITKAQLGVVAHGLRHEHANDAYQADTGVPSPVRGGLVPPPDDAEARQRTARLLGHNRARVTSCYLGKSVVMRTKAPGDLASGEEAATEGTV